MPKQKLAISIRNLAATVRQINVQTHKENDALSEASAMLRTLAAILDGKPLAKAFGTPGDWGWETEIGKAVHELHCLPEVTWPKARDVGRFGDMSPQHRLGLGAEGGRLAHTLALNLRPPLVPGFSDVRHACPLCGIACGIFAGARTVPCGIVRDFAGFAWPANVGVYVG